MTADETTIDGTTRHQMKSYWEEHGANTTLETMMLDTNAKKLHEMELPEIMDKAPAFEGKDVLELAAGIGRYTGVLAPKAKTVTAVEFIEDFHKKNVTSHSHFGNVRFLHQDVVSLECEPNSFDVIFSNWLFMYLSDEEVHAFARKAVQWLRPGGKLFFRESCFRQSGNVKRSKNPTNYRHPSFYIGAFAAVFSKQEDGTLGYFNLVSSSSISVYRKVKQNSGQVCFHYVKDVRKGEAGSIESFQRFLDQQQYSNKSITRYEKIFGKGYVSTGGQATTTEFVEKLNLKPGERVLDVGCGIGGGNFYMARQFGVAVVGIDLSTNMIHRALEDSMEYPSLDVEFEICDATTRDYPDESFDVIYSRDTILHIQDKQGLFAKFYRWLRPGGRVLISDYCCGEQAPSDRFKAYVAQRGYHLLPPTKYGETLTRVGFQDVVAEDRTKHFMAVLSEELERTLVNRDEFIRDTSQEDFEAIVNGWKAKLQRCADGDQRWGLFYGIKR